MADKNEPKVEDKVDTAKVQHIVEKESEQGFRGAPELGDPTPNENYTVAGVTAGKPTPETDPDQAAKVNSTKFWLR
jgi:hypothetical protein